MSANDNQVGGKHYKSKIQHWDWVWENQLDYFQGQITKYVSRWKQKNGVEDLKKARHFLDKYIELVEASPNTDKLEIMLNVPSTLAYEGGSMADDFWQCKICRVHLRSDRGSLPDHDATTCLKAQETK